MCLRAMTTGARYVNNNFVRLVHGYNILCGVVFPAKLLHIRVFVELRFSLLIFLRYYVGGGPLL